MSIKWIDPPRDYRDLAADLAQELLDYPNRWALILEDSPEIDQYEAELKAYGITTRKYNVREVESGHPRYRTWTQGDLYARAEVIA